MNADAADKAGRPDPVDGDQWGDAGERADARNRAAPGRPRSARRRSRELAVQGLYQWLVAAEDAGAIEAHLAETEGFEKADLAHFKDLLHGSIRDIGTLHAAMEPHVDRKLVELSPVEHATLLVGCYELLHHPEIPYRVIINEAVELAKTFGGTDGYKYVNGVLDRVGGKIRPHE